MPARPAPGRPSWQWGEREWGVGAALVEQSRDRANANTLAALAAAFIELHSFIYELIYMNYDIKGPTAD